MNEETEKSIGRRERGGGGGGGGGGGYIAAPVAGKDVKERRPRSFFLDRFFVHALIPNNRNVVCLLPRVLIYTYIRRLPFSEQLLADRVVQLALPVVHVTIVRYGSEACAVPPPSPNRHVISRLLLFVFNAR
jgi:hypothetical protein